MWSNKLSILYILGHLILNNIFYDAKPVMIPIVQLGKLRHKGVWWLTQGYKVVVLEFSTQYPCLIPQCILVTTTLDQGNAYTNVYKGNNEIDWVNKTWYYPITQTTIQILISQDTATWIDVEKSPRYIVGGKKYVINKLICIFKKLKSHIAVFIAIYKKV